MPYTDTECRRLAKIHSEMNRIVRIVISLPMTCFHDTQGVVFSALFLTMCTSSVQTTCFLEKKNLLRLDETLMSVYLLA